MKRTFSKLSVGLLTCGLATSCTVGQESDDEVNAFPGKDPLIIGGTVTADDPAVLWLYGEGVACTGTLVAPRVVLTAGHCFATNTRIQNVGSWGTRWGTARRNPGYSVTSSGAPVNDSGVVILDKPIVGIDPLPIRPAIAGAPARKVGFGKSDSNGSLTWDGQKRTVNVTFNYDNGSPFSAVNGGYLKMGTAACFGDSGGPTLQMISNVWSVVGISSFVTNNCFGNSWDWVAQRSADWVRSQIEETAECNTTADCGTYEALYGERLSCYQSRCKIAQATFHPGACTAHACWPDHWPTAQKRCEEEGFARAIGQQSWQVAGDVIWVGGWGWLDGWLGWHQAAIHGGRAMQRVTCER